MRRIWRWSGKKSSGGQGRRLETDTAIPGACTWPSVLQEQSRFWRELGGISPPPRRQEAISKTRQKACRPSARALRLLRDRSSRGRPSGRACHPGKRLPGARSRRREHDRLLQGRRIGRHRRSRRPGAVFAAGGRSADRVEKTIEILGLNVQRLRTARKDYWNNLSRKRPAYHGNSNATRDWARGRLLPKNGALPKFFTVSRSYFGELGERILAQHPRDWI